MKKLSIKQLLCLGALLTASSCYAAQPGGYFGLAAGYTNVNIDSLYEDLTGYKNTNAGGLGGRFFYGYNFNPNFGLEVGYSKFNRASTEYNGYDGYYYYNQKVSYNNEAIDLVAKLYAPINTSLDFYVLGGASYVHNKVDLDSIYWNDSYDTDNTKVLPKIGIGANYDLGNHWSLGGELAHIYGDKNLDSTDDVPGVCMALVTLSYHVN